MLTYLVILDVSGASAVLVLDLEEVSAGAVSDDLRENTSCVLSLVIEILMICRSRE